MRAVGVLLGDLWTSPNDRDVSNTGTHCNLGRDDEAGFQLGTILGNRRS